MEKLKREIGDLIDASHPMIYINTTEEYNVMQLLHSIQKNIDIFSFLDEENIILFLESYTLGFEELEGKLIVLRDVEFLFDKQQKDYIKTILLLKKIVQKILHDGISASIILLAPKYILPLQLQDYIYIINTIPPTENEIIDIIQNVANIQEEEVSPEDLKKLAYIFKGLYEEDIKLLLNRMYQQTGEISIKSSSKFILEEKRQIIKKSNILDIIISDENSNSIGGLNVLKKFLLDKAKVFTEPQKAKDFGVSMPKGVFLVGMPGCGKSLSAKVASHIFNNIPLLKLEMGKIMGKYVGESEENMRKVLQQAENISPAILWIDEIEKAFSGVGGANSNEVTTRLFGYFLTWLQEHKSAVYVIATANNIENLPPELLRKGRFDEVFFIDLPNKREREEIFKLHIEKRGHLIEQINFSKLINNTDGFSGSDIEAVVEMTIEEAFLKNILKENILTELYLNNCKNITSISKIMGDSINRYEEIKKTVKSASSE